MPARERWSQENQGTRRGLRLLQWWGGEGRGFSYLLESHMTYLAGSHVLRSWPGIRLTAISSFIYQDIFQNLVYLVPSFKIIPYTLIPHPPPVILDLVHLQTAP
jgi:hypothetical protein